MSTPNTQITQIILYSNFRESIPILCTINIDSHHPSAIHWINDYLEGVEGDRALGRSDLSTKAETCF